MTPIPLDKNLFMMCDFVPQDAFRKLPDTFTIRNCKSDEFQVWKELQSSDWEPERIPALHTWLDNYFKDVYAPYGNMFFNQCKFVCDKNGKVIGTCFIWKAYGLVNTIQWFKVLKEYEGRGIGRALMSYLLADLADGDFPIFLHTHPTSLRAIKLYSDFGFKFITDKKIGTRNNDLKECLPILCEYMPATDFEKLKTVSAPKYFLDAVNSRSIDEF